MTNTFNEIWVKVELFLQTKLLRHIKDKGDRCFINVLSRISKFVVFVSFTGRRMPMMHFYSINLVFFS